MDVNFEKALSKSIKTGEVIFGSKRSIKLAKNNNIKLLIIAKNCPERILELIKNTNYDEKTIYKYSGTSKKLGTICGKPFPIAVISILNQGDSEILSIINNK